MKSMCQEPRRNSPSVTPSRPISSCIRTASRIAASSVRHNSSADKRPASCSARARSNSGGRNRLPTWSARNGGRDILLIPTSLLIVAGLQRHCERNDVSLLERDVVVEVVERGAGAGRGGGGARLVAEAAAGIAFVVAA